jgi:hypothetical protein
MSPDEKNVQSILDKSVFHIPYYQRPYSWDTDQCEQLWDDLFEQYEANEEAKNKSEKEADGAAPYFLGVIVLANSDENTRKAHKREDNEDIVYDVIDGQQRLITLSLLLRALQTTDGSKDASVEKCLCRYTGSNDKSFTIRFDSDVAGKTEPDSLRKWLWAAEDTPNPSKDSKNAHERNYAFFGEKVKELFNSKPGERTGFRRFILHTTILLRVTCESTEDALKIFSTLNARGLDLSDGDILKAELARKAHKDDTGGESGFVSRWGTLVTSLERLNIKAKESPISVLFRHYMHVLRGENNDTSKTIVLRDFFDGRWYNPKSKKKENQDTYKLVVPPSNGGQGRTWNDTLTALEKLTDVLSLVYTDNDVEFQVWKEILDAYGPDSWKYPVTALIYRQVKDKDNLDWSDAERRKCCQFMRNLARFRYAKGLGAHPAMPDIFGNSEEDKQRNPSTEDAMFAATILAVRGEMFIPRVDFEKEVAPLLDKELSTHPLRYGISAIIEFAPSGHIAKLHEQLKGDKGSVENLFRKTQVEHILPKDWGANYYEKWDKDKVERVLNTLGNLMLLESPKNIGGSNKFFSAKQKYYEKSAFSEARALVENHRDKEWTYDMYEERHDRCKEVLKNFFEKEAE